MLALVPIALFALQGDSSTLGRVCIDPGHPSEVGRGTSGKKVSELEAVWVLANGLASKLQSAGIQVIWTKDEQNQFQSNRSRAEKANRSKADLMIRLHMDAAAERGIATFYPAAQGKVDGIVGPSDRVIALSGVAGRAFHAGLVGALQGLVQDRGLRTDRQTSVGSRQGALTGSIYSQVPVLLVEVLVLTNPKDEAIYLSSKGRERLISALYEGTLKALKALKKRAHKIDP